MISTGISSSLRRPQTFHKFSYLMGGRSLSVLPQRIVLIGTQKGGTAAANTPIEIPDPETSAALFGKGTEVDLMVRKAFETGGSLGKGPVIFGCGIAEPGGGSARVQTITPTGTATASGNVELKIKGVAISVGVSVGDTQNTIATAIQKEITRYYEILPITVAVALNVVTATLNYKGVTGADVVFEVVSAPAGVTVATTQTVAGSGVADYTTALANLLAVDYDVLAFANHAAADVAAALSHLAAAWSPTEKRWRWIVLGETGTIGTATALSSAANEKGMLVASCEGSASLPSELAAAVALAITAQARPNANYDGMVLPLAPPSASIAYTTSEVESALAAGLTPLVPIQDPQTRAIKPGVVSISRMVTTCTTISGSPSELLRDLAVSRAGAYLARVYDVKYAERFGPAANPDGVLATANTAQGVRDMISDVNYAAQDNLIIKNVDDDLTQLVVEYDSGAPGRINVDVKYTIIVGLHQVAFVHRVTLAA